jgi:hypothetical protein
MEWRALVGMSLIALALLTPAAPLPETTTKTTLSPSRLLNFGLRRLQLLKFNKERW